MYTRTRINKTTLIIIRVLYITWYMSWTKISPAPCVMACQILTPFFSFLNNKECSDSILQLSLFCSFIRLDNDDDNGDDGYADDDDDNDDINDYNDDDNHNDDDDDDGQS